jgi:hypothetical protein
MRSYSSFYHIPHYVPDISFIPKRARYCITSEQYSSTLPDRDQSQGGGFGFHSVLSLPSLSRSPDAQIVHSRLPKTATVPTMTQGACQATDLTTTNMCYLARFDVPKDTGVFSDRSDDCDKNNNYYFADNANPIPIQTQGSMIHIEPQLPHHIVGF